MSTSDFDESRQRQLAKKLRIRPVHLETVRQRGLYQLDEGEAYPPLYLETWAGANLWDRGVISGDEARYLDSFQLPQAREKILGWLKALRIRDDLPEFPGKLKRDSEGDILIGFAGICTNLEADTDKAKMLVLEILESLSDEENTCFRFERSRQDSRFPDTIAVSISP